MDKIKNFKSLCSGVMRISTPGKFSYDFYSNLKNYIGNTQDIDDIEGKDGFVTKLKNYTYKNKYWFNVVNDNTVISDININGEEVVITANKFEYPSKNNKFLRIDVFEYNNGEKEAFFVAKNNNKYTFISLSRTTSTNDYASIYFYDGKFSSSLQQYLGITTDIKRIKTINLSFKDELSSKLNALKYCLLNEVGTEEVGNNKQKYGEWYYEQWLIAHNENEPKENWIKATQWCGQFVSWCFNQIGISLDSEETFGFKYCPDGKRTLLKKGGMLIKSGEQPKLGDVVFYYWGASKPQHTGVVISYDVKKNEMTTIEGNTSEGKNDPSGGKVMQKTRKFNSELIVIRPKSLIR